MVWKLWFWCCGVVVVLFGKKRVKWWCGWGGVVYWRNVLEWLWVWGGVWCGGRIIGLVLGWLVCGVEGWCVVVVWYFWFVEL